MVKIAKAKKSTHSRGKASKNLRTGKSLTIRKEEDPNAEWEIDVSLNSPEEILESGISGLNKGRSRHKYILGYKLYHTEFV